MDRNFLSARPPCRDGLRRIGADRVHADSARRHGNQKRNPHGCRLSDFDQVLCDTKSDRDRLQIHFRSYPDGGTSNQSGIELYQPGALLLTLAWRNGRLITQWGEYNAEAANREREGAQFKKISPPRAK